MRAARALAAVATIAIVLALYLGIARPAQLHWGATADEISRPMPGDALSQAPTFLSTRAITIDGTPAEIWPWLVQMGYGRAGFYGYDILENLGSPRGLDSARAIDPELQGLAAGDSLPLSALARLVVHEIVPERHLVWAGERGEYPGAFTWALYPVDEHRTRLVSRIQWSHHWNQPLMLALDLFTDLTDGIAVRKILHGVKDRAEGRVEPFWRQTLEFVIYLWALVAFPIAIVVTLRRPLGWPAWLAGLGAGLAWLVVWYAPLPMPVAVLLNGLVVWGLIRSRPARSA
jgi:hypothetical protein